MRVESALLFESVEEIYIRVFRDLRPRTPPPSLRVEFCEFANANNFISLSQGALHVRMTDLLRDAPAPIVEALAYILIGKLYRVRIPAAYTHRYRLYLNRRDTRTHLERLKRLRGRKLIAPASGDHYDLVEIFEDLNLRYFHGLMARPELGWSLRTSRSTLGHYDPSHHAIVINRLMDRADVPRVAVEYVMFHEMLHLRHPVEHRGSRRCVHTREFKEAEKKFAELKLAKEILKKI